MTANRISKLKEIMSLEEKRAELQSKINALDEQIASIQNSLYTGKGKPAIASKSKAVATGGRKGRGALRQEILEALAAVGQKGAAVLELATLLNTKPANIHSWFSTNLKKTKGLKKVGEARYALTGAIPAAPANKAAEPAAAPAKRGRKPTAKPAKPAAKPSAKATAAPKTAKGTAKRGRAAAKSAKAVKEPKAAKAPAAPKAKATRRAAAAEGKAAPAKRGALKAAILEHLKAAGSAGISISDLAEKTGVKYKNLYIWFLTTGKRIPGIEKVGSAQYALK